MDFEKPDSRSLCDRPLFDRVANEDCPVSECSTCGARQPLGSSSIGRWESAGQSKDTPSA